MEHTAYLSIRVTHPQFGCEDTELFRNLVDYYQINCEKYLETLGYITISYVCGLHLEAEAPHIHLHYLVNTGKSSIPKVFIQHWQYHWKHKLAPLNPNPKFKGVSLDYPCLFSTKHKRKINISIQYTLAKEGEPFDRFLAYPLKEGHLVSHSLASSDVERLMAQAQGEWNVAKIKNLKEKQKMQRATSEYGKICEIISSNKPESYTDAIRLVLEEVKNTRVEFKEHVNPRFLIQAVQKYCYHSGIWSVDDILDKFA